MRFKDATVQTTAGKSPQRKHPETPQDSGNCLEWVQNKGKVTIWMSLVGPVILIALLTIESKGFGWVTFWVFWVIIAGLFGIILLIARGTWVAAGSDWLQAHKSWVNTYKVTTIKARTGGVANYYMEFHDADGSRIRSVSLMDLQQNQALWDLVYNGLMHSLRDGADVNRLARSCLNLGPADSD